MPQLKRPKSLTESVTDKLRRAIIEGDLPLGSPLSERGIAESIGVSKTPVREAFAQLRVEGLVRIKPQTGAAVFSMSAPEVTALSEARLVLEQGALRFAFERNRKNLVKKLTAQVEAMEAARQKDDVRLYLDLDSAYHDSFFDLCGNAYLAENYSILVARVAAIRTHLSAKPRHTSQSMKEHRQILEAIEASDIREANDILEHHILRARRTYDEHDGDIVETDRRDGEAERQPAPLKELDLE
ncbi:MAG: GntR family transcriptional regulator [Rhodospirillales bacterium]|nr:GntR family transcriptional regulator [Rhodospirillales bacterium]